MVFFSDNLCILLLCSFFWTKIQNFVVLPLEISSNYLKPVGSQGVLWYKYVQDLHKYIKWLCVWFKTYEDQLVQWDKKLGKSEVNQQLAESKLASLEQSLTSLTKVASLEQAVNKEVSAIMTRMAPVSANLVVKPTTGFCQLKARDLSYGQGSKRICSYHSDICQLATTEQLASSNSDSDSDFTMLEEGTVTFRMIVSDDSEEPTWKLVTSKNQQSHTRPWAEECFLIWQVSDNYCKPEVKCGPHRACQKNVKLQHLSAALWPVGLDGTTVSEQR